jgi:hypothetical protein
MTDVTSDAEPQIRRTFTVEEANALLPALDRILREMGEAAALVGELGELIQDMESYWGRTLHEASNPDHQEWARRREEVRTAARAAKELAAQVAAFGCELKDPHHGLVDFPAVIDGRLAYLCWQRGEREVGYWHDLEAGFAGRRPLTARDP